MPEDKIQSRDTKEFADRGSREVETGETGISQNVAVRAMGVVEGRSERLGGKIKKMPRQLHVTKRAPNGLPSIGEKIEKMPCQLTRRGAGSKWPAEQITQKLLTKNVLRESGFHKTAARDKGTQSLYSYGTNQDSMNTITTANNLRGGTRHSGGEVVLGAEGKGTARIRRPSRPINVNAKTKGKFVGRLPREVFVYLVNAIRPEARFPPIYNVDTKKADLNLRISLQEEERAEAARARARVQRGLRQRDARWGRCRGGAGDACSWEVAHVGGDTMGKRGTVVGSAEGARAVESRRTSEVRVDTRRAVGVPWRRRARGRTRAVIRRTRRMRGGSRTPQRSRRGADDAGGCSEGRERGGVVAPSAVATGLGADEGQDGSGRAAQRVRGASARKRGGRQRQERRRTGGHLRTGRGTGGGGEARRACRYGGRRRRGKGAGPSAVRKSPCRRRPETAPGKGTQREVPAAHQAGSDVGCGKRVQRPLEAGADAVEGGQWPADTGCRRWRKRCVGHVGLSGGANDAQGSGGRRTGRNAAMGRPGRARRAAAVGSRCREAPPMWSRLSIDEADEAGTAARTRRWDLKTAMAERGHATMTRWWATCSGAKGKEKARRRSRDSDQVGCGRRYFKVGRPRRAATTSLEQRRNEEEGA
ncbi:hypothetical protein DFH08DRAFT_1021774 [Mycena albidolilacea]|uniref:Uncharacterized protein n=1 Tax=Mycena albidolilacea TaxID=1033008 RepID=A0AAD6ZMW7_9AGAR|nr:hypothetical protein DFH08DRAFT_1021774 [Mycena albidolilacea]